VAGERGKWEGGGAGREIRLAHPHLEDAFVSRGCAVVAVASVHRGTRDVIGILPSTPPLSPKCVMVRVVSTWSPQPPKVSKNEACCARGLFLVQIAAGAKSIQGSNSGGGERGRMRGPAFTSHSPILLPSPVVLSNSHLICSATTMKMKNTSILQKYEGKPQAKEATGERTREERGKGGRRGEERGGWEEDTFGQHQDTR